MVTHDDRGRKSERSRSRIKRSVSKGRIGKIKNKKNKILSKVKSKNAADSFSLSGPIGFKRVGHIDFDPQTGEFTVCTIIFIYITRYQHKIIGIACRMGSYVRMFWNDKR